MKKIVFLYLIFGVLSCLVANAEEVVIDGIKYNLIAKDDSAEVISNSYSGEIIIPSSVVYNGSTYSVKSIGMYAFLNCSALTSVTIPNSVKTIEDSAFHGCSGLISVTIPNSVTTIGGAAFADCLGLTSVTIGNSVTSIGLSAFEGCSGLTSVTIGNSVTTIGLYAFNGCSGLTSVTIPNSVTTISLHAFQNCTKMTSVTIGNSVTTIEEFAFFNCSALSSIIIPNSVKTIGGAAFSGCSALTSVIIGNSVTSIGSSAFGSCVSLTDVYCPGEKAPHSSGAFDKENVKNTSLHVKDYAIETFKGVEPWTFFKEIVCEKVTDFNLTYYVDGEIYKQYKHKYEDAITAEAEPTKKGYTFSGWSEIPSTMPSKHVDVTGTFSISRLAKEKVIYEVADTLNNYCKVIGNDNASGEVKIDPVEIDGCYYQPTEIADKAFYGCKSITSIKIPATVATIGERAFANIDKLTDVTCLAEDLPAIDRTAFENSYIEDYVTLHVPASALEKYKAAAPWKNFMNIVAIDGTNDISDIKFIPSDQQGAAIYSIDGRRLDKAHKGLNIIRTSDGRTRKVIVR